MVRKNLALMMLCGIASVPALGQTTPTNTEPRKVGMASDREHPLVPAGPTADPQSAASLMHRNGGSLLRATLMAPPDAKQAPLKSVSVFAVPEPEAKTVKKHDLVTIIIREETEVTSEATSDLKRQADLNASVSAFSRINFANMALEPAIGSVAPTWTANGTRNFKGEATVDRTDSLITRVQAEVVDVKPNGTLVLQARKKIKHDEEEQVLTCSGICRVEDITPDNTVLSTQLFDLEFTKTNKGQVRNATKTGVLHKLLDFLNPF